jgi:hypothetical protein
MDVNWRFLLGGIASASACILAFALIGHNKERKQICNREYLKRVRWGTPSSMAALNYLENQCQRAFEPKDWTKWKHGDALHPLNFSLNQSKREIPVLIDLLLAVDSYSSAGERVQLDDAHLIRHRLGLTADGVLLNTGRVQFDCGEALSPRPSRHTAFLVSSQADGIRVGVIDDDDDEHTTKKANKRRKKNDVRFRARAVYLFADNSK